MEFEVSYLVHGDLQQKVTDTPETAGMMVMSLLASDDIDWYAPVTVNRIS